MYSESSLKSQKTVKKSTPQDITIQKHPRVHFYRLAISKTRKHLKKY